MRTSTNPIESALGLFQQYKELTEKAVAQLSNIELFNVPESESNSIAVIMKHMSGNMLSRFTDFLTSDGEKPWRNRDGEFEIDSMDKNALMEYWEKGWACLFHALEPLKEEDLKKTITIRNEPHSVLEAINRSLTHLSYHAGQIVYVAKMYRSSEWKTLTIPKKKKM